MDVGRQIKKYRISLGLSQEELAEKVYVSRQTISNWETGKSYPDLHSVLLLGAVFNVSLDELVKGDVEIMKEEIQKSEIEKLNRWSGIYSVLLILSVVSLVPLLSWLSWWGLIPWAALYAVTFWVALKVEKIKKENNISTYKEIVAFLEGKRLDEMETQREIGKRPYQNVLKILVGCAIGFAVAYLMSKIFPW